MAYGLSNGHVTDDFMWPWKVKLLTPIIYLERSISKTAGFRDSVPKDHQAEMTYDIRDPWSKDHREFPFWNWKIPPPPAKEKIPVTENE